MDASQHIQIARADLASRSPSPASSDGAAAQDRFREALSRLVSADEAASAAVHDGLGGGGEEEEDGPPAADNDNDDDDAAAFAFNLFAPSNGHVDKIRLSPGPAAETKPQERPPGYYFAPAMTDARRLECEACAVTYDEILAQAATPWPDSAFYASLFAQRAARGQASLAAPAVGARDAAGRRTRVGKKTRIKRRKSAARAAKREEEKRKKEEGERRRAEEKDEYLRQKKREVNRKKQIRKREKKRAAEGEGGADADADADADAAAETTPTA